METLTSLTTIAYILSITLMLWGQYDAV